MQKKLSVIIPVYNVSAYLRQCLDSLCAQTLSDLEIVCVDDGSTDDSLSILQEYAKKDPRFVVLTGPNGGYGRAMNRGLAAAHGDYIGIVEPDDYAEPDMFRDLLSCAEEHDLDFVKSDSYRFSSRPSGEEELTCVRTDPSGKYYGRLLCPASDPSLLHLQMNIWTGIYRKEFLDVNRIRFHESPGASFQDNGFYFQTFVFARRAMILNKAYYKKRRDNPNSSVHNKEKVFCMNQEYDFIRDRLMEDREVWERFKYTYWAIKYRNYMFSLDRIDASFRKEFLLRMQSEFLRAQQKGELSREAFSDTSWRKLSSIMNNAGGFTLAMRMEDAFRKLSPVVPKRAKKLVFKVLSFGK